MNRRNSQFLKIFLYMLVLNFFFLCIYFVFHSSSSPEPQSHFPVGRFHVTASNQSIQKPWPILPSYLPWTPPPRDVRVGSCEGYFGNGFTRRVDFLRPRISGGVSDRSWFRCFYSATLRSSICEGGNLRMVPDRIVMSKGGERLEEVMGRREEEELPQFQEGAFEVAEERSRPGFKSRRDGGGGGNPRRLVNDEMLNAYIPGGDIERHTMRDLMASIRAVDLEDFACEEWVEEPTLLVTRFEYANLFHTMTDWYSAYVSSRVTGLPTRPHVVFLDGHCSTQLEETWMALFSGIRYAKNFTNPVCFRHVILSPLGYETTLFKGLHEDINCEGVSSHDLWQNPDDTKTARLSEFGEMIRSAFEFQVNRQKPQPPPHHSILFVRREDYLAHPRHRGKVESRLSNEEEVFEAIQRWIGSGSGSTGLKCGMNLVNGLFGHMTMREQVRAIQEASVIVGAHGAGLTHVVSATSKAVVFEIVSSSFRRPHFRLIAKWKGIEYRAMNLVGSYADPKEVVEKMKEVVGKVKHIELEIDFLVVQWIFYFFFFA
ncbi:PREDICTED: beta-(1,2)-xylosyltransferase [Tarenaya hassleriana]|uniref:beta-(1,2)-xylosyltransferase n=1 Tax=Tarenaya hassleriana TaxID=28532 RepID=UPI00053C5B66|nr:PREDICTED: beta-(1,2)-xylosyltransferase [Tarenaya hassleriana]